MKLLKEQSQLIGLNKKINIKMIKKSKKIFFSRKKFINLSNN